MFTTSGQPVASLAVPMADDHPPRMDDPVPVANADVAVDSQASLVPLKPVRMKRARAIPQPHPECVKCSAKKPRSHGPSAWSVFLKKYQNENPGMAATEAIVEARKRYVPPSGRKKSFERIFRELWRIRNPCWKTLYNPEQAKDKMREDFLAKI